MKDKIIVAFLAGIIIGICILGFPIIKSGGKFVYKVEEVRKKLEENDKFQSAYNDSFIKEIVNLRNRVKYLETHRHYR